jgi:hypothetical protein
MQQCLGPLCLVPFAVNAPKFFGFSEFLAGLALMVLAWTTADARYRFRISTAPLPLQGITFSVVTIVGVLTLLTDLWRAENWLVLDGVYITSTVWQAILGAFFLLTFMTWAWYAFLRPPVYGRNNAIRFRQTLYKSILKGDPVELAVIADELSHSSKTLIRFAYDKSIRSSLHNKNKAPKEVTTANEILLLIGDKRFCNAIVESSSGTALAFFEEINVTGKYGVNIEIFSKNVLNEALLNKNSFLYHETAIYESGLIGYHKPLSQAMFSNHKMVDGIGTLFDPDVWDMDKWDKVQWKTYVRIVLIAFKDYIENSIWNISPVLFRAKSNIESAISDVYKLDGITNISIHEDIPGKLRVVVSFISEAVKILNNNQIPPNMILRVKEKYINETVYDYIAELTFNVIYSSSQVQSPIYQCWAIQHNLVWSEIFRLRKMEGEAGKIIRFKVRRLIYNEIKDMTQYPNFIGASVLGLCLNILGFKIKKQDMFKEDNILLKAILAWTKKNFDALYFNYPQIAERSLVDGITYDDINKCLIKTYPANGLRREPRSDYFYVETGLNTK